MYSFAKYKAQYRENLKLALPIILTQLGQMLTQFADNLMVGRYGGDDPVPLAATSLGGAVFFILFGFVIGVAMGLTPLVGELFAQGERRKAGGLLKNGIIFYSIFGLLVAAIQYFTIPLLYKLGQPIEVVDMAIPYYKMLIYSLPFVTIFFAFKQFLEGVGNTKTVMYITIVSNVLNVILNSIFISGRFGIEAMGAEGAGLSTLISRAITPIMLIAYFVSKRRYNFYLRGSWFEALKWSSVTKLVRMGFPIGTQIFVESSAFIATGFMMGWLGTHAISANQISHTVFNAIWMVIVSIGSSTTIIISHNFGSQSFKSLRAAAYASYHLVLTYCAFMAVVFIALHNYIPMLFTTNAEVIQIASQLLLLVILFQISDGVQHISVGILRGLQDVKIIIPIAIISYWALNLPIGYLFGFVFELGPQGLFFGYIFGISIAAVLLIWRIRQTLRRLERDNSLALHHKR